MLTIMQRHPYETAIEEAERCRKDARAAVEHSSEHAALKDKPSGWCVVTQKGLWSRVYHNMYGEEKLKEHLDRGHKVLLTVGIVAAADAQLNSANHVAFVRIAESCKVSEFKRDLIAVRAKLHATRALLG